MSPVLLQVSDLVFSWSDLVPVLDGVSFDLPARVTGLVGPNGAGKSTLLQLLAGELRPARGSVRTPPPAAFCPQEPVLDDLVRAFAWGWVDGAWALQARLGLDPADLERWDTLSAGQRRRWQLGAAFAAAPATLLLDEPTNHLDEDARLWVLEALGGWRGVAVVATHDRELLDHVCARVLRLDRGGVVLTSGGWAEARAAWELERKQVRDALDAASEATRHARRVLADQRRQRDATEAASRTSSRMKGPKDHDARGALTKGRIASALAGRSRRVGVARAELERAEEQLAGLERPTELGGAIRFRSAPGARARLVAWRGDLRAGEHVLARDVERVVDRGDHIHLAGPNGSGKSTLLRTLLAAASLPEERVLYLPQELSEAETRERLDHLRRLPSDERGRVMQAVAALGVAPERIASTESPSPGEARKLAIAMGLGRGAWLLLLDEPTNHLDLPSVERLQAALAGWDGALVLVTHDHALAAAVTTSRWDTSPRERA